MYSDEQVEDLQKKSRFYLIRCYDLQVKLVLMSQKMKGGAFDHAVYGIGRRLRTLKECLRFFFDNLPVNLDEEADSDLLAQGNANLHAFLINCSGISDNIAWFLAHHLCLDQDQDLEKKRHDIGLFNKIFKKHLTKNVAIKVDEFKNWYNHIINHRHPTAHRIPPYLIPSVHYDNTGEIDYTPRYIHALDKSCPVPLHAQVICDIGAVVELVEALITDVEEIYA